MTKFDLLRKIYDSLDDGNGILDFSLEGENRLVIWTEDENKFIINVEEEREDIMSLINELKEKSNNAQNIKYKVIEEIKKYFDEYLEGDDLEIFLRDTIKDSDIQRRKKFMQIKFWEYQSGCSETYFYCAGKFWYNPENRQSWFYKSVNLKTIDREIGEYLSHKLINKMKELGFVLLSADYHNNRFGYYERYFYFGW